MLETSSGNAILGHCQEVMLTLSSIGFKFKREIHSRISEACRHGNLAAPPEVRSAGPVSLRMMCHLFDEAGKRSLATIQNRALDISLITYATMCRSGEICRLGATDVLGSTTGADAKISITQKQHRRKGARTTRTVPAAV